MQEKEIGWYSVSIKIRSDLNTFESLVSRYRKPNR